MREQMKAEVEADMKKRAFAWAQEEVKKSKIEVEETYKKQSIELDSLRKRDEESRKKETEFFKQQNEFEMLKKNLELEKEKARIEERKKLEEEFAKQSQDKIKLELEKFAFENEKKLRAKDEQIQQMQRSIEDAKRKWDQWSMQIQWEIQEDALRALLESTFPIDIISDVEKWIKWADIIQEVRSEFGQSIGIIAWESKNTKAWSDSWIEKLKEDRLRVNASISILVSAVLPKWIEKFWLHNGVWVVEWSYVPQIAMILRSQMIEIASIQNSLIGRDERLENIFTYLTSPKFHDKISNILSAFHLMQEQVSEERRAFESRWKKREDLLEKVIKKTAWMHGDLKWMLGSQLGTVEYLELWDGL